MLRSLLPCFKQIMIAIKALLHESTISIVDMIGWSKEAEQAFNVAGREVVPLLGGVGHVKEEARGGEPLWRWGQGWYTRP
jgi:hypothetical protein